jgi:hypothetical protein
MAIDNMYRRRRLGPPLGVRMALSHVVLWFAALNALFTGIAWLFESSDPKP